MSNEALTQTSDLSPVENIGTYVANMEDLERYHGNKAKGLKESNTLKAYERHWERFSVFAGGQVALPVAPALCMAYLQHLENEGKKASTINQAMAAISHQHELKGLISPVNHPQVKTVLASIRKQAKKQRSKQAKPLSLKAVFPILRDLYYSASHKDARDRAIIIVGFAGAFRRSEVASLKWCDLDLSADESKLTVTLDHTKTGAQVKTLFAGRQKETCPITALKRLQRFSGDCEYVFQSIRKGDKATGKPISDRSVDQVIRNHCGDNYSGHSLRVGFVSEARQRGEAYDSIMKQTGHKSLEVVKGYARSVDNSVNNAAKGITD